jgi:hypothetical protein
MKIQKGRKMKRILFVLGICTVSISPSLWGATVYSTQNSFMGPGIFYGPGSIEDTPLFDVTIHNVGFSYPLKFVTPFFNNGPLEPNIGGETEIGKKANGLLSDGVTKINENIDASAFDLNGVKMLVGIINGGPHAGQQISVALDDGVMIMTMDFALDMGLGKSGIIKLPFYGTTGEATVPYSLQTQMGIEGGIDRAGSLPSGTKLKGRLGDFDNDGMLDGAIVVGGNMPLNSIILPGAPYALIRYFETDIPYNGQIMGKLPGPRYEKGKEPPMFRILPPQTKSETPKE